MHDGGELTQWARERPQRGPTLWWPPPRPDPRSDVIAGVLRFYLVSSSFPVSLVPFFQAR